MLVCLVYNNGRVEVTDTIQGHVSHDLTLNLLKQARDRFDCRIETPHTANPLWQPVTNENWSMSPSVLQPIERTSEEFEKIATKFARQIEHVIEINKVENSSWLSKYSNQRKAIKDRRHLGDEIEQILVFPCAQVRAEHILQYGFINDDKGISTDEIF